MSAAAFDPSHPETWPLVLTFGEVCQVFRTPQSSGYEQRQAGRFPVPELLPRVAKGPRYHRDDVLLSLKSRSGQASALERRKALHGIR